MIPFSILILLLYSIKKGKHCPLPLFNAIETLF
jgi:hypothetical protein